MSRALRIRTARAGDAQTIALYNMAMAQETERLPLDRKTVLGGVKIVLGDRARGRYFVLEKEGRIRAQLLVTMEWSDWRSAYFWWIQSVYVPPGDRGRGYFRKLFDHVRRQAAREGSCGLRLYTARRNRAAKRIYRRLGMEPSIYDMYELCGSML